MQLQTGEYQKLQVRQYPQRTLRETAEGRYWKQFRGTTALQQVSESAARWTASISSAALLQLNARADRRRHSHRLCAGVPLQLCGHELHPGEAWSVNAIRTPPLKSHYVLWDASRRPYPCGMQVLLYNGRTQQLERQVTRFKDIAYSGCYRVDGRLLTAGGENGIVQVRDGRQHDVGLVLHLAIHRVLGPHVRPRNALVVDSEFCVYEQVFDVGSRAVLRQLKGHQRPVHVARFSPDKLHVLSGGDDATV